MVGLPSKFRQVGARGLLGRSLTIATLLAVSACNQVVVNQAGTRQYDATATVVYTWQAAYFPDGVSPDRPNDMRIEKFESVSLINHNGIRPGEAVTGPDEAGLWWPALPPKPTVDDLEGQAEKGERAEQPELIKSVDYAIAFDKAGESVALPTNYQVYRQAVKAYPDQLPLSLTLGPNDASVINAKIQ